jgi:hypothetical protein
MRFFVRLSIMIVLGFLGARWIMDSGPSTGGSSSADTKALLAVIRSANAYSASPCSDTYQASFMNALANYARRVQTAARCKVGGRCDESEIRSAVASMHSPMNADVRSTLIDAVRSGEIKVSDFKAVARLAVGGPTDFSRARQRC